jgi:hypothetical protein
MSLLLRIRPTWQRKYCISSTLFDILDFNAAILTHSLPSYCTAKVAIHHTLSTKSITEQLHIVILSLIQPTSTCPLTTAYTQSCINIGITYNSYWIRYKNRKWLCPSHHIAHKHAAVTDQYFSYQSSLGVLYCEVSSIVIVLFIGWYQLSSVDLTQSVYTYRFYVLILSQSRLAYSLIGFILHDTSIRQLHVMFLSFSQTQVESRLLCSLLWLLPILIHL